MSHLCLGGCCLLAGSFCRVRHSGEGAPIACLRLSPFTECFCCQLSGWQVLQCADEPQDFGHSKLLFVVGAVGAASSLVVPWSHFFLPCGGVWEMGMPTEPVVICLSPYSSTYISQPSPAPTPSYNTSLPCGGDA